MDEPLFLRTTRFVFYDLYLTQDKSQSVCLIGRERRTKLHFNSLGWVQFGKRLRLFANGHRRLQRDDKFGGFR
jgi:hypothetical protein